MLSQNENKLHLGVNQIGYFGKGFGLGESSRLMLEALKQAGIPVSLISVNDLLVNVRDEPFLYPIENVFKYPINLFTIDTTQIPIFIERNGWNHFKNRHNIGLVFWETTHTTQAYAKGWEYLDEIWTTSRFMQEVLSRIAPTAIPVHYIPQPLELAYSYRSTNQTKKELPHLFTYLFFFSFNSVLGRKNPQAIIDAFHIAFPDEKKVRLIIKSKDSQNFSEQLKNMQKKIERDSRVVWIDEVMDEQERFNLMNRCDCYISLHRSEGFGLTLCEAMLLNKPVIATGYSGNIDFMNDHNSYLCSYRFVPVGEGNPPYPPDGIWAEPDIHHAAQLMRHVFENQEEAITKAHRGREFIQELYNFKRVGTSIAKRLAHIPLPIKNKCQPWIYTKNQIFQRKNKILRTLKNFIKFFLKK